MEEGDGTGLKIPQAAKNKQTNQKPKKEYFVTQKECSFKNQSKCHDLIMGRDFLIKIMKIFFYVFLKFPPFIFRSVLYIWCEERSVRKLSLKRYYLQYHQTISNT